VKVQELPGKPGVFACTVHLQPHFQFDDVVSAFKLVTELAPSVPG
jgi:predicted component of type VI protein secretion system